MMSKETNCTQRNGKTTKRNSGSQRVWCGTKRAEKSLNLPTGWKILGHAAYPVVPLNESYQTIFEVLGDRQRGSPIVRSVPDGFQKQGNGAAGGYDRYAACLYLALGDQREVTGYSIVTATTSTRKVSDPKQSELPADSERPGDGEHYRGTERPYFEPSLLPA